MYRTNLDINTILDQPPFKAFDDKVVNFLSNLSVRIMNQTGLRKFPDLASFGFFIRKSNLQHIEKLHKKENDCHIGLGTAFHIAPSNVPLNFAYSLVTAILCGNPSIVRISSKKFEQSELLIRLINEELNNGSYQPFFTLLQYSHDDELNNKLSYECRLRLIWGGDNTIKSFKSMNVKANVLDITFPDKYSISLIDACYYNEIADFRNVALKFYNDVYTFDQNACTSPRGVFWLGKEIDVIKAQKKFWDVLANIIIHKNYMPNTGAGVRRLNSIVKFAAQDKIINSDICPQIGMNVLDIKNGEAELFSEHSGEGLFYQKRIKCLDELRVFVNEKCQTLSVFSDQKMQIIDWVVNSRLTGIDRVCDVGKTSEFSFNWDGKSLFNLMTKNIAS